MNNGIESNNLPNGEVGGQPKIPIRLNARIYKNIFILKYGQTNLASDLYRFYTLTNDIGTAHKI